VEEELLERTRSGSEYARVRDDDGAAAGDPST